MSHATYRRLFWTHVLACVVFILDGASAVALDIRDEIENSRSFFSGPSLIQPIVSQGLFVAIFTYVTIRCIRLLRSKEFEAFRDGFGLFCVIAWIVPCAISIIGLPSFLPKPSEGWVYYDDDLGKEVNLAFEFGTALV
jgi:hypothetical protein